jgi:hypothetical protein
VPSPALAQAIGAGHVHSPSTATELTVPERVKRQSCRPDMATANSRRSHVLAKPSAQLLSNRRNLMTL